MKKIIEGWKNHISPEQKLKETIDSTSKLRMEICRKCPFHSSNREGYSTLRVDEHCTKCGCTLIAKTKCLSCECPDDPPRWMAVNPLEN